MTDEAITRDGVDAGPRGSTRGLRAAALAAALLAACGGGDTPTDEGAGGEAATSGGETGTARAADDAADPGRAARGDGRDDDDADLDGVADGGEAPDDATDGDGDAPDGDAPDDGAGAAGGLAAADAPDPEEVWRTKVRRGRRVFERVCGVCHPGGEEDLGPRIIGANLSIPVVRRQIRDGVGRMRPIPPSKLPERYMDELFAYLSTIDVVRGVRRP